MNPPHIMILGIGNILLSDEGFGVRVVERLREQYKFADNISVVDGGVMGLDLLGIISEADHLIVVDTVKNNGEPGDLYRLEAEAVKDQVASKSSLHQVDFTDVLTMCRALGKVPETVILGVEPKDIETLSTELTPATFEKVGRMADLVMAELGRLGGAYQKRGGS
jgi:hydrogenase maturation protease